MLVKAIYNGNQDLRGIKRIEIPKTENDFLPSNGYGIKAIKKNFANIISQHKLNAQKEWYLYQYYLGVQDIQNKQRPYLKDVLNNSQVCENHALRQVDFKVGFITSEQREYTAKDGVDIGGNAKDDLTYLNRYFTDTNFFGKDKELKEWIYACGVGCTDIRPRTDIIDYYIDKNGKEQARFLGKEDGFDILTQSPFEFNVVSPINSFVVYSSGRNHEPLFCVTCVEVERNPNDEKDLSTEIEYQIETKWAIFKVRSSINWKNPNGLVLDKIKTTNNIIPIIEHCSKRARIGVIEINKSLFDNINQVVSSITDTVVDNSNMILVFKNTDIDDETIKKMKQSGAVEIFDSLNGKQNSTASVDTLSLSIDYNGFNSFYEQRVTQAYDIAGVPLASGQVTSGGDTGQARLLGGGWSNATTISTNEVNTMKISDNEVLKQILYICKLYPNCPINSITASQIDIKYKLNSSDNFLVKAQGIMNLYSVNMPKETILKASGLVNDIGATASQWESYDKEKQETKNNTIT